MAQAGDLDLQQYKGDDWDDAFQIKDSGIARDLTGYTARMYVKANYSDPDPPVVALTTTNGRLVIRANQTTTGKGYIDMAVTNIVSAALSPGSYVYDLEIINAANKVKKYIRGKFTIVIEATTGT